MGKLIFRSDKVRQTLEAFNDAGYKQLLKMSKQTPAYVKRSKTQIIANYQKTDPDGTVEYITPSGTSPGVFYRQRVLLADLKKLIKKYKNKKKPREIVSLAIKGNIKVSCNDPIENLEPSWLYQGFIYKATAMKYNQGKPENRFPDVRNPKLKGSLCKHLIQVLTVLPFSAAKITSDLVAAGLFQVKLKK